MAIKLLGSFMRLSMHADYETLCVLRKVCAKREETRLRVPLGLRGRGRGGRMIAACDSYAGFVMPAGQGRNERIAASSCLANQSGAA